jgi:hypothetical protein
MQSLSWPCESALAQIRFRVDKQNAPTLIIRGSDGSHSHSHDGVVCHEHHDEDIKDGRVAIDQVILFTIIIFIYIYIYDYLIIYYYSGCNIEDVLLKDIC